MTRRVPSTYLGEEDGARLAGVEHAQREKERDHHDDEDLEEQVDGRSKSTGGASRREEQVDDTHTSIEQHHHSVTSEWLRGASLTLLCATHVMSTANLEEVEDVERHELDTPAAPHVCDGW